MRLRLPETRGDAVREIREAMTRGGSVDVAARILEVNPRTLRRILGLLTDAEIAAFRGPARR